jgi:putative nucleotidyltransferase with HDIG domain/PAS domain S-box-containing protein
MVFQCRNDSSRTLEYASKGCFELTGYPAEDLVRNQVISYGDLIYPDDREMVWINIQNAIVLRKSFELVYRIHTQNRQVKWVREVGSASANDDGGYQLLEGFVSDITDWKKAEETIQRQVCRLQALRTIDSAIAARSELQITLEVVLEQIMAQLNIDAASILLHRAGSPILECGASRGFRTGAYLNEKIRMGEGFAGMVALTQQMIHIPDLPPESNLGAQPLPLEAEGFKSYYGIPLIANRQLKGVLEVFLRTPRSIDPDRLEFLETLAGQATIALDNSSLFEQLQDSNIELSSAYDATLEGWAKALELRDRETVGHAHRVIELTLTIANRLGICGESLQHIRRGALLHDIGKMGIPDSILLKPGPLSPHEWEVMRQHPVHAYEMLKTIGYLNPAMEIPYSHHERWDGKGYPQGLVGKNIPISARIFAIVDVWDALTSNRPYRYAWTEQQALEYIIQETGRHFDPEIVKIFLK